jgi:predicted dehydrogenase
MSNIAVGVVGCGYWGPNLIRNLSSCPLTELVAACDANPARVEATRRAFRHLDVVDSLDRLLELPLDAIAIATPVSTHFPIAKRCLEAGLHVLVEKPLAATVTEARALTELAQQHGKVLMVDHTYLFSNAVRRIKDLVDSGELGELYYIDSVRINLGLFQRDVNVIWDLAPHDLSIVDYVLNCEARSISASGVAHASTDMEDVAYINVDFGDRMLANFHVNWLSPVKVRQMIFAGSRKSLIYNELNTTEPIKVYDKGIDIAENLEERRQVLIDYRTGDVWSPHIPPGEPLQAVVTHFAECIRDGSIPISDGGLGTRVVRMLEAATRSARAHGGRVVLSNGAYGNGHTRERGNGEIPAHRSGRASGEGRDDVRLREPVRVPDRG